MLSRATWVSLWFLFMFLILTGKAHHQKDPEMYCDDAYRAKYIVSTSLFNVNQNMINDTDNIEGKSILTPPIVTDNNELFSDNGKDNSGENSVESLDQSSKKSHFNIDNYSSGNKFSSNEVRDSHPAKVSAVAHQHHPLVVVVNTQINVSVSNDGREDSSVYRRRKRDAWEGQNTCLHTRRIIGGTAVDNIEEIPYIVFIDTGCAGTIISNLWVLTAAHCIGVRIPKYVYGGNIKLFTGCKHKIEKIIIHPNYYEKTYKADITLLRLYQPFTYSPAIKPISMDSDMPKPGACGIISGWGSTKVGGKMEYYLRTTMLPIIRKEKCKMFPNIDEDQFCAGFQDAHTDTCQGDSGGPFIVNNLLVGIVSFGYKCAMREIPGVYVNVPYYRKWIENITGIE